ncbi:MAG: type III-B CRISPR module RAMP protein Cmr4 [Halanaerobiales bacterium]|nr:type III-B CRISPR module RAMP protein Cmr4 [Halanaerobiales bacterium]
MIEQQLITPEKNVFTYLVKTIDPVHIGAGGYRMDYIDNLIVRDFDTIPKIPGTSLSGVARHYLAKQQSDEKTGAKCGGNNSNCDNGICIVCKTFGVAKNKVQRQGAVQFSDALLLFFPVATMSGTVWITTISRLKEFTESIRTEIADRDVDETSIENVFVSLHYVPSVIPEGMYYKLTNRTPYLELNGVLYDQYEMNNQDSSSLEIYIPVDFQRSLVVVTEKTFIQTVENNLEVRTSVSIDPETGTAKGTALFTYEAIPRNTYLYFQIVINPPKALQSSEFQSIIQFRKNVEEGMKFYSIVGVGGKKTRGFGRLELAQLINQKKVKNLIFCGD